MAQPKIYAQYFRLAVDVSKPATQVKDVYSSAVPVVATGAALEFELAFSEGALADGSILDLSVYDSIEFKIQSSGSPHSTVVYIAASIANADFQVLASKAVWDDLSSQQLKVSIPSAENVLQPTTGATGNYWLCIYGKLSAAAAAAEDKTAGDAVPLCFFQISVIDSGIPVTDPSLPLTFKAGSALSFVCSDGKTRDVTFSLLGNGRWGLEIEQAGHNGPGQAVFSLYCADANWRDLSVILVQGVWTLDVGQAGHA